MGEGCRGRPLGLGELTVAPIEVRAAGGLVVRPRRGLIEVMVVHRPRYDDWSLPKGKADPGESDEACALREVEEETGLRCRLGRELPSTRYVDRKGRPKRVRYWEMAIEGEGADRAEEVFVPNDEVDEVRWLTVQDAAALLSYPHDVALVASALAGGA